MKAGQKRKIETHNKPPQSDLAYGQAADAGIYVSKIMNIKYLASIAIIFFSMTAEASRFLQVYRIDDSSVQIVECQADKDGPKCQFRTHSTNRACVLTSKVNYYSGSDVSYSAEDFSWKVRSFKDDDYCKIESTTVVKETELVTSLKVVEARIELCKEFDNVRVSIPRLETGKNPSLSTHGCSNFTILYQ